MRDAFVAAIMGRRPITPSALVIPGNQQMRDALTADPLAIGYLPASWLDDSVKSLTLDGVSHQWVALNTPGYPITLPLYFVTADQPSDEAAALLAFLSGANGARTAAGPLWPAAGENRTMIDPARPDLQALSLSTMWMQHRFELVADFAAAALALGFGGIELSHIVTPAMLADADLASLRVRSIHFPAPTMPSPFGLPAETLLSASDDMARTLGG